MAKVSSRIFLKQVTKSLFKILVRAFLVGLILTGFAYLVGLKVDFPFSTILRFFGFLSMFVGAISKLSTGDAGHNPNFQYTLTGKKVNRQIHQDRNDLFSNDRFLIICIMSGAMVFAFSIFLDKL